MYIYIYIYKGGTVYTGHPNAEGEWTSESSTRTSTIKVQYPGGESYKGDLKNGMPHGVGTRTMASGRTYHGQFERGRRHGAGRMVLASGENLQGSFIGRGGSLTGTGTIALQGGAEMSGTFADGMLHGEGGLYRSSNGVCWHGHFHNSTLSGHASMSCPAETHQGKEGFPASEFVGSVENNRTHGAGEITFGVLRYEGTWVDGELQGHGTLRESFGKRGQAVTEETTIVLFRKGFGRDDVLAEFAEVDSMSDDD